MVKLIKNNKLNKIKMMERLKQIFHMKRRGVAYTWIVILFTLFVIALLYIIFSPVINELLGFAAEHNVPTQNVAIIEKSWYWFPIVLIFGLFIYGIIRAQKREPDWGMYVIPFFLLTSFLFLAKPAFAYSCIMNKGDIAKYELNYTKLGLPEGTWIVLDFSNISFVEPDLSNIKVECENCGYYLADDYKLLINSSATIYITKEDNYIKNKPPQNFYDYIYLSSMDSYAEWFYDPICVKVSSGSFSRIFYLKYNGNVYKNIYIELITTKTDSNYYDIGWDSSYCVSTTNSVLYANSDNNGPEFYEYTSNSYVTLHKSYIRFHVINGKIVFKTYRYWSVNYAGNLVVKVVAKKSSGYSTYLTVYSISGYHNNIYVSDSIAIEQVGNICNYYRNGIMQMSVNECNDIYLEIYIYGSYDSTGSIGIQFKNITYGIYRLKVYPIYYLQVANFTFMAKHYNITLRDELTGQNWDINKEGNETLKIYCPNGIDTINLNKNYFSFWSTGIDKIQCGIDYGSTSYFREIYLKKQKDFNNIECYLVDATQKQLLQINFQLQDITGQFSDAYLIIQKNINGQLKNIYVTKFDVEKKAVTYLAKDEAYKIVLESNNAYRDFGYMVADASGTKTIVAGEIKLNPNIKMIYNTLSWNIYAENNTIHIDYKDKAGETNKVIVKIYTNGQEIYSTTVEGQQANDVAVTYNADINKTYIIKLMIYNNRWGVLTIMDTLSIYPYGALPMNINKKWLNYLTIGLIVLVSMTFGALFAPVGGLIVALLAVLFWYWGWLQISYTILGIAVALAILRLLTE